ncbi:hypothetical protein BSTP3_139 [Bacillus phage BSTP3]|nr:hypothetical protein BSTP3_139 [Bacillus phage BSTP3]
MKSNKQPRYRGRGIRAYTSKNKGYPLVFFIMYRHRIPHMPIK